MSYIKIQRNLKKGETVLCAVVDSNSSRFKPRYHVVTNSRYINIMSNSTDQGRITTSKPLRRLVDVSYGFTLSAIDETKIQMTFEDRRGKNTLVARVDTPNDGKTLLEKLKLLSKQN